MKGKIEYLDSWKICETQFSEKYLAKFESIMALGNGYLTVRNAHEEAYSKDHRNFFVAGIFDKFSSEEVTELASFPDVSKIEIYIDGQRFSLLSGTVIDYQRVFDYQTGESKRTFKWQMDSISLQFSFKKFASMADKHLLVTQVKIENLGKSIDLEIISGIDGTYTNSGSQHFEEGDKRVFDDQILYLSTHTQESQIPIAIATFNQLDHLHESRKVIGRRTLTEKKSFLFKENENLTFTKKSVVRTDCDLENQSPDYLKIDLIDLLTSYQEKSYRELFKESVDAWKKIWQASYLKITSTNVADQLFANFARYHLHGMSPIHDSRMNIGAKGMTGEGYKGHTFWDTEIFILPYFIYSFPEWAKNLVTYRIKGLAGAKKNATNNGYLGAQYPWEAAWPSYGETTPKFGEIDILTGAATPILTGEIEHHVTSDVVYGAINYVKASKDIEFKEKLFELLMETAIFWTSRVTYNDVLTRFEILDVIGPDEYKEHVNNNAYTNYLAKFNLDAAVSAFEEQTVEKQKQYKKEIEAIRKVASNLYLPQPNEKNIIPQDDTYLEKEVIDLSKYLSHKQVNTIFQEYNLEQINEMQVSKQADILLLFLLFPNQFDRQTLSDNWNYYYPKTLHDSSLSLTTHCNLALRLGKKELAYELYQKAFDIDMSSKNMSSSDLGVHAAAMGGAWQNIVFGFGGFSLENGIGVINPQLPDTWEQLDYTINIADSQIYVCILRDKIQVKLNKGNMQKLSINGKIITFKEKKIETSW